MATEIELQGAFERGRLVGISQCVKVIDDHIKDLNAGVNVRNNALDEMVKTMTALTKPPDAALDELKAVLKKATHDDT